MLNYSGYYNKSDDDLPSDETELLVKSCGHYKLIHLNRMETVRPYGRRDYQLIYVAEGVAHFTLEGRSYDVGRGGLFLYKPEVPQDYYYILQDKPDIYWIHFTGRGVDRLLDSLRFQAGCPMQLQAKEELIELFERIITELRMERMAGIDMAEAYFRQLLILMARSCYSGDKEQRGYHSMLDEVIGQMHHEYQKDINIALLADGCHISCCWFIREFKRYTGYTPKQYITNLRLQNAKELLNNHSLSISDVANLVGYDNQLYFSRIFRKYIGMSPSEYRDGNM
jgi:AraC family transcriptional regulator, arabinose operon regulatory protein